MLYTTITGSLPKPSWLATPRMLWAPWVREGDALAEAKRDAVLVALKEQEAAGIDIVTDGEQSRQHFVHGFLEHVDGIDFATRVRMGIRANRYTAELPRVVGPIARTRPIHADEVRFARAHTTRKLKLTIPGPMTIVDTVADEHYRDRSRLAVAVGRGRGLCGLLRHRPSGARRRCAPAHCRHFGAIAAHVLKWVRHP